MKKLLVIGMLLIPVWNHAQESDTTLLESTIGEQHLNEVVINAAAGDMQQSIRSTQMGKIDLPLSILAKVPAIAGEPDVIKALQTTPGVKRGSEGSIGMYVRGGGKDENLILMDGAPVYNAGHMLGFFSVFNMQALREVNMYKSSFPAQFGGRLSSVLDIRTRDGDMQHYKGAASLGLISSSATFQGPIIKDKLSFFVTGRRTYADRILRYIPYYFYDVNGKLTYRVNERNRLYLSWYKGNDVMDMQRSGEDSAGAAYTLKTGMILGNDVASIRWNNRPAHEKYTSDITAYYSGFKYRVDGKMGNNELSMRSAIRDIGLKGDWRWQQAGAHQIRTGFNYGFHHFNPNMVRTEGAALEQFTSRDGKNITNQEMALYIQDEMRLSDRWQVLAGLRLSGATAKDVLYWNPEPRLAARYQINENSSLKGSFARMAQYMQLVSSSSLTLPTDLWYPVTSSVRPGISDQVSAGYYHVLAEAGISLTAEVYYKWMNNLVEYREGALLVLNDDYEKELLHGKGRGYGLELFAARTSGKFTGWIGYSLSFAERNFDSLNNGRKYYARYDRRHDLSVIGMYQLNDRWSFNAVVQYATGSPFTGQQGQYVVPKPDLSGFDILPVYTSRNALRLSSSFRIDFDIQYKFRLGSKISGDAHLSVYNVMNRAQPYRVERVYSEVKKEFVYQQKGLFGIIPAFAINFNI